MIRVKSSCAAHEASLNILKEFRRGDQCPEELPGIAVTRSLDRPIRAPALRGKHVSIGTVVLLLLLLLLIVIMVIVMMVVAMAMEIKGINGLNRIKL